jgi:hypothetical protein
MSWCDTKRMRSWTVAEIQDWYDNHPDIVLSDYAKSLGLTLTRLKQILMP